MGSLFRKIEREQCQKQVDGAAASLRPLPARRDWIYLVRRALGMSGAQLAQRLGVSRNQALKLEKSERLGAISLRRLDDVAQAMGCRLVYGFVPERDIETTIRDQAERKALKLVSEASVHMMLEAQSLSPEDEKKEIQRMTDTLVNDMPRDLWTDDDNYR